MIMTLSFASAASRNLTIRVEEQKDTGSRRSQHVEERGARMGELWGKTDTGLDQ